MGGSSSVPTKTPRVTRLPIQDDSAINSTRRRTAASMLNRKGRSSTILSDALRNITGSEGYLGR